MLLSLALPLIVGCPRRPSVWIERQDRLEVNAEGAGLLSSVTQNGHQKLLGVAEARDGKAVVQAHVRAGGADQDDAQAALDAVRVKAELAGDTVKVGWTWNTDELESWGASVDFDITLPENLEVHAETHNGAITARGLAASCRFVTHNGKVTAETGGPALNVRIHNGELDIATSAPEVILESHNGSISAKLNAEGDVGGTISTHNGGITVALGDSAATALDCSVNNGAIHCARQLEQGRVKPDRLSGSIRGGQRPLKIETHNGSIRIQ